MRICASLALVMTVALTAACSTSTAENKNNGPAAAADNSTGAVDNSLRLQQLDGMAVVTVLSITKSYKQSDDANEPESGNFVAVELKFECTVGKFSVHQGYLKLKKPDGTVIEPLDGEGDWIIPDEEDGELSQGKILTGTAVFDTAFDPGASFILTDTVSHISGEWPLAGGKPRAGDGIPKRQVDKSLTDKDANGSALVTLVAVSDAKGGLDEDAKPESGNYVVIDMKFEGKTGEYSVDADYVKLKKPDGTLVGHRDGNGILGVPSTQELRPSGIVPGQTTVGRIAFDTPSVPGSAIVLVDADDAILGELPL